jgi:hypothetical protein
MNFNEKRVYSVNPPKGPEDCMALTPNEALMYNLRGIKLIDMTKEHGMSVNQLRLMKKDKSYEGGGYGTIFG